MFYKQCKELRLDCPSSFFDGQIVKSDATVNGKRPQMGRPVAPSSSFLWWCRFLCRFFAEGQTIKGKAKTRSPLRDNGFHWSCWADSNRRPHPYQRKIFGFSNLFSLFIVISIPSKSLSSTFATQNFRLFRLRLWLVVWSRVETEVAQNILICAKIAMNCLQHIPEAL